MSSPDKGRNLAAASSDQQGPPFPILLDGLDRAVAFDDMAIALRSVAEGHKLDHQCMDIRAHMLRG